MMQAPTKNNTAQEVADFLRGLEKAAISTHTVPDGDAMGSAVALVYLLRTLGADDAVFCHAEEVPN
jgi:bifunctional oligoribonuclease and PAP phosphatase NrnA